MSQDALSQLSTIATTVVLVGGLIFGAIRWLNTQSDKKVAKAKQEAEATALELRQLTEHVAQQIKGEAEHTAADVKGLTSRLAEEVRVNSDIVNKEIMKKIDQVDARVTEMLGDLRRRADLTNGNVATIRTDLADINDDIQELYDQLPIPPDSSESGGGNGKGKSLQMRKAREREREKKQRIKRRKIEEDRVQQSERALQEQRH